MQEKFLTSIIHKFYPQTAEKIQELISSNILLEKLSVNVYEKLESAVQKYADIASRIKHIANMVEAWRLKQYDGISTYAIFICIAILLYFVSPIDLFPDFIPIIGGLDDLLLLNYLLKVVDKEIEKFTTWQTAQQ